MNMNSNRPPSMDDSFKSAVDRHRPGQPLPTPTETDVQQVLNNKQVTRSITAVLSYYDSVKYSGQAIALWPDAPTAYQKVWARRLEEGLAHAWDKMDYATRARYLALASEDSETQTEGLKDE